MTNVSPCSYEEADTRLILHVTAAINLGKDQIAAKPVDSDVLVLCVAAASQYSHVKLCVEFGTGKNQHIIPAQSC